MKTEGIGGNRKRRGAYDGNPNPGETILDGRGLGIKNKEKKRFHVLWGKRVD